jgi:hypothetical protein
MNSVTRPQGNEFYTEKEQDGEGISESGFRFESDLVNVGSRRNFLLPGDLVEIT